MPALARPRAPSRWILPAAPDGAAVAALADSLHLPLPVCQLLYARGYADPEAAKRFLRPRMEQMHAPSSMRGLTDAVERLARAIERGETILVHGDYDVD